MANGAASIGSMLAAVAVPAAPSPVTGASFAEARDGWVYEYHAIPKSHIPIPPPPVANAAIAAEWYVVCKWKNPLRSNESPYGATVVGSRVHFEVKAGVKHFAVGAPLAREPTCAAPAPTAHEVDDDDYADPPMEELLRDLDEMREFRGDEGDEDEGEDAGAERGDEAEDMEEERPHVDDVAETSSTTASTDDSD